MQVAARCPAHAFVYNGTHCACNPGYLFNSSRSCILFSEGSSAVEQGSGVYYESSLSIPGTVFSFDSITRFTQSQAVFLEATAVMVAGWLGFCLLLRAFPLGSDGRSLRYKIRWWISRLDVSYATRHWLDDRKLVVKRKTELGGAFSIAGWILFIGLFAALLYQIISKRSVEVHNVRATNAPDLASFLNDLEFNITTISSMSCVQLRGLGTLVMGNPVLNDQRAVPLATFANYSCLNTTIGPTITLKCNSCRLVRDFAYISWQFVDIPNNPATAIGFQFNLTAKNHRGKKRLSFVSGTLKNASDFDDKPITFRGSLPNILKFNLFPRIFRNLHDLKLIQPMFHEFLRGSYFDEANQLQASLQSSRDGLINTTLFVNFLSSYIVEIDTENILGPVSFLADLGGLYCISIGIFLFFLVQCEYRIKRLRNEDVAMRKIRNSRKAQDHWAKLRKYVKYTWGSSTLDDYGNEPHRGCCTGVLRKSLPSQRSETSLGLDILGFNESTILSGDKKTAKKDANTEEINSCSTKSTLNPDINSSATEHKREDRIYQNTEAKWENNHQTDIADLPPLPSFEWRDPGEISMMDLQENLQKLYTYNVMLREKLISKDRVLAEKETRQ